MKRMALSQAILRPCSPKSTFLPCWLMRNWLTRFGTCGMLMWLTTRLLSWHGGCGTSSSNDIVSCCRYKRARAPRYRKLTTILSSPTKFPRRIRRKKLKCSRNQMIRIGRIFLRHHESGRRGQYGPKRCTSSDRLCFSKANCRLTKTYTLKAA